MKGNSDVKSILLVGVGGQGILRASDILCHVMMEAGLDVKKSEVHGMAQRGGSVISHVRYGKRVYSPIAKLGDVDILVSFEKLETLRYINYLIPGGYVIINEREIYPPSVNLGDAAYPPHIIEMIKGTGNIVKIVHAQRVALTAGDVRTENTALLGALSSKLKRLDISLWEKVIKESFPKKAIEVNLKAFHMGREA